MSLPKAVIIRITSNYRKREAQLHIRNWQITNINNSIPRNYKSPCNLQRGSQGTLTAGLFIYVFMRDIAPLKVILEFSAQ